MNLVVAVAVGTLFGAGVYLMTRDDLVRLVAGTLLIANAALLLLVSAGFAAHVETPASADSAASTADPLVQALALTAVVINFATTVLLLRVMVAVGTTHESFSVEHLVESEVAEEAEREHGRGGPA